MQGKSINGYVLQQPLGIGGMAEVWLAENKIGKKAAVKLLLPKLCDNSNVTDRFLTEAKVMVELNHHYIRQVYDYGDIDGRPSIVMEYLEGDDLKNRMTNGQHFSEADLVKWWNQLVEALNYTHSKGIVHRDIKPANIFVDTDGNIKLLDFGIAKVRESISMTQTGQKLGTLMYMSPEQVKDSKHIDCHTDYYSLAVTFFHLISGRRPYDSETTSDFEISSQIVYSPLDLTGLPDEWRALLSPYLNKDPMQRPELKPFPDKSHHPYSNPSQSAENSASGNERDSKGNSGNDETIIDNGKSSNGRNSTQHNHNSENEATIIDGGASNGSHSGPTSGNDKDTNHKYCSKCGTKSSLNARFCRICGRKF